jgi:hypothetical protein
MGASPPVARSLGVLMYRPVNAPRAARHFSIKTKKINKL